LIGQGQAKFPKVLQTVRKLTCNGFRLGERCVSVRTMTHIAGHDRSQTLLLPESLDDYVGPESPVRFIEAFVDGLDLTAAGFIRVAAKRTGRPGFAPADLLKLYIYGYLNRVRSSRRLEAETHRNIEVIWLLRDGQETHARLPRHASNGKRNGTMAKPKREYLDYLNDILSNMELAEKFVAGIAGAQELQDDKQSAYATSRAIERVGEAMKKVPADVRKKYAQVPWKDIAGMRDKLAHDYFDINYDGWLDVVTQDIPHDKPFVRQIGAEELQRRRQQAAADTE